MHREFEVHILNPTGITKAKEIASTFDALLTVLDQLCPAGREYAIVKTKLEEASFFAKKSMATQPENQFLQP
jgi:hypothetical protein